MLKPHAACLIFPEMEPAEFEALKADIATHGQREAITVHEGQILDGRHRYRACLKLGIEPKIVQWGGSGSVVEYVVSLNLLRRHLTSSQRAMVALDVERELAKEARERQIAGGKLKVPQIVAEAKGEAREKAASITKTNRQYVSDAKAIAAKAPELVEKVKAGELTIPQAKREIKRTENAKKVAEWKADASQKPTKAVNLILADPPWQYDFTETESRAIENQYQSAGVNDICGHISDSRLPPIDDNCVLLLWATAPKLQDALEVMKSWGFTYKTHAIWDKQKIGMGYWFRGQHELLLVGTKGKASPPDDQERVSSIFSEARGRHSAKPECVYAWIERAFPMHSKLEMYCRSARPGWQVYGNEALAA